PTRQHPNLPPHRSRGRLDRTGAERRARCRLRLSTARPSPPSRRDRGDRRLRVDCHATGVTAVTRCSCARGSTIARTGGRAMAPTTLELPEKVIDLRADLKPEVGRLAQDTLSITDNRTGKKY